MNKTIYNNVHIVLDNLSNLTIFRWSFFPQRRIITLFFVFILPCILLAQVHEIKRIPVGNLDTLKGRLCLPNGSTNIKELVIFVPGTGPNTYMNKRKIAGKEVNYYDLYASEFNKRGIAFFSYNRKGVDISDKAPFYDTVDRVKYKQSVPSKEAEDIAKAILFLKKTDRLKASKVVLLGWSEGTIIAPLVASNNPKLVHALILAGYANENMIDVMRRQNSDISVMMKIQKYLDLDSNSVITRAEYEDKNATSTSIRTGALKNGPFTSFDLNGDSVLNELDWKKMFAERFDKIIKEFEAGNEDWIWKNYFRVSIEWYKEHKSLQANNSRMLGLNLPIYICQGEEDRNTPVEMTKDIERSFEQHKKKNLHCFYFKEHNHDLNYTDWIYKNSVSYGIAKIIELAVMLE